MAKLGDDNSPVRPVIAGGSDPHGEAALLLVESLIHGLIADGVLTSGMAIETVQTAIDAQDEIEFDRGDLPDSQSPVIVLLDRVIASLRLDDLA